MSDAAWLTQNENYLAAALAWLRLRLEQHASTIVAPAPATPAHPPAPVVVRAAAPSPPGAELPDDGGWWQRLWHKSAALPTARSLPATRPPGRGGRTGQRAAAGRACQRPGRPARAGRGRPRRRRRHAAAGAADPGTTARAGRVRAQRAAAVRRSRTRHAGRPAVRAGSGPGLPNIRAGAGTIR